MAHYNRKIARPQEASSVSAIFGGAETPRTIKTHPSEFKRHTVTSSGVDRIEHDMRTKIETLGFGGDPSAALKKLFMQFDADRSGKISDQEFVRAGVNKLNFNGFELEMAALFRRYDIDGNGKLSAEEFGTALFKEEGAKHVSTVGKIREVLAQRGGKGKCTTVTLARQFRLADKDRSGQIDRYELERILTLFLASVDFKLSPREIQDLMNVFDKNRDGRIGINEFMSTIRGRMNKRRALLVKEAFKRIDTNNNGVATLAEISQLYDCSQHPKVISGEMSAAEVMDDFIDQWDKDESDSVTLEEFSETYNNISSNIDSDEYFELMIRNAWHMSGGQGQAENTSCRRVLVTHPDGRKTVEEIKNDLGIGPTDFDKMKQRLAEQGITAVDIKTAY